MKNLYKSRKFGRATLMGLAAVLLVSVGFYACKKPNEGINLLVNTSSLAKAPVLIHFVNANPESTTAIKDFDVKISGKDAAIVQMDGGSTDFKASNGFLPLALTSVAAPSKANPVKFNVYATIPGFAPITQTVTITEDSPSVVDISVIEYAKPVVGTAVATAQSALNSGTSAGGTINVNPGEGMKEKAVVTIPSGTQMLDANGGVINANSLTANLVNFSAVSRTSYGAFPGGFNPTNVVDEAGNPINGGFGINFVSAGLLSVKMTAGSSEVKKFSKPVLVDMTLDPNTTNFTTGENIKAGDQVPLWSLEESTGQWKREGMVTIVSENGSLVAKFTTTHLSCFNLDWSWAISGVSYGTCNVPLTVNLNIGAGVTGVYDVALVTPNNQYLAAAHGEVLTNGGKVVFPNVANIAKAKVVISDFNLYLNPRLPILAQTEIFNPCTKGSVNLTFQGPPPPDFINVKINVTAKCSNKSVEIKPSGWFELYDYVTGIWTCLYLQNGNIIYNSGAPVSQSNGQYAIKLVAGRQYYMSTYSTGSYYSSSNFTLSKSDFTTQAGGGIALVGKYTAADNSLTLSGNYNGNCK
ncbi:hypothetical protein [Mucilaginibacter auburnensis]|uniref:Uncharacterized protein n=1 Tax=Mucilaginibacter auburnensis TaxID=1457233 RepID=A0A2H9VQ12_9SPHI|nr:hypothetical protein [Mucilaginibacter auburnensis]PJJ80428.1 hypothetical protein CLV57_3579 [Mucilaginibacter auburnensis]